jgi:hypothetical protein
MHPIRAANPRKLAWLALLSTLIAIPAVGSPGDLDSTFNGNGVVNLNLVDGEQYDISSLLVAPDESDVDTTSTALSSHIPGIYPHTNILFFKP